MKKVIRLTESDLTRIVKRVIKENENEEYLEKIKIFVDNGHFEPALQLGQSLDLENEVIDLIIDEIIEKKFPKFNEIFYRTVRRGTYSVEHPIFTPTLIYFIKTDPDFKMVLGQIDPNKSQKKYAEIYSKMREKFLENLGIYN